MNARDRHFNAELHQVVTYINSWHRPHGATVLIHNETVSRKQRALTFMVRLSMFGCALSMLFGAIPSITTNNQLQRIECCVAFVLYVVLTFQTYLFICKRKELLEVVQWCHWVEMRPTFVCQTPDNWFGSVRTRFLQICK